MRSRFITWLVEVYKVLLRLNFKALDDDNF